jgi:hypothetical protein
VLPRAVYLRTDGRVRHDLPSFAHEPSGLVERRLGQTAAPPGFGEGRKWRVRLAAADSAGRLDGVAVEQLLAHG